MKKRFLTTERITNFIAHLREEERSVSTLQKYLHDLSVTARHFAEEELTKTEMIKWKQELCQRYAPASVNTILSSVNGLFNFYGWHDLTVKPLKIQKVLFADGRKELNRQEYAKLVRAAEKEENWRLSLVIQTICSTGIRVSELQFITVEAVASGRAEINNKGKRRTIFLPDKLRRILREYLRKQKRTTGAVFVTRTGKLLNRSNIWREMKALCKNAGVDSSKVFPHNLRHLFARTYYSIEKDLSRLADILGHSNVNTTKIYTVESGFVHARQVERLGLIVT